MAVNEAMRQAVWSAISHDPAQAVINAAWPKFDKDDKSTWPKENEWCFVEMQSEKRKPAFLQFIKGRWWPHNGIVVRYAYPSDLLHFPTEKD